MTNQITDTRIVNILAKADSALARFGKGAVHFPKDKGIFGTSCLPCSIDDGRRQPGFFPNHRFGFNAVWATFRYIFVWKRELQDTRCDLAMYPTDTDERESYESRCKALELKIAQAIPQLEERGFWGALLRAIREEGLDAERFVEDLCETNFCGVLSEECAAITPQVIVRCLTNQLP